MVRGLALRSLTSLRLESVLEYVDQPLRKCLSDLSAYVRKTAVMGILKVCHASICLTFPFHEIGLIFFFLIFLNLCNR